MNNADARPAIQPRSTGCCPSSFPAFPSAKPLDRHARRFNSRCLLRCCGLALVMMIACDFAHAEQPPAASDYLAARPDPFAAFVSEAAQRFDIPEQWIRAVMQVESAGDVQALSPKGAMGLMQIMPDTWADLRLRYGLGTNPFDPHDNIVAGAAYLRELHDRYGERGFLAAYNAGPARYEDYLAIDRPLPVETQNYVAILSPMVTGEHADRAIIVAASARPWTNAPLFAVQTSRAGVLVRSAIATRVSDSPNATAIADWTALAPQSDGLFVPTTARIQVP